MELEAVLALCVVQLGSGVERHVQGPEDNRQDKSQCTADRSCGEICHLTAVECQQSAGPASILDAQDCMGNTQVYFASAWKMTKSSTCRMRCVYQSSVPPYAAWAQVELAIPPPENLIRQAACWRDLQHLLCLLFLTSPDAVYLISKLPCRSLDAVCLLHWVTHRHLSGIWCPVSNEILSV